MYFSERDCSNFIELKTELQRIPFSSSISLLENWYHSAVNNFQWHVECKSILNLESIKWIKWKWKFVEYLCHYAFWARGIKKKTERVIRSQYNFFLQKKSLHGRKQQKIRLYIKANYSNCKCIFPIEWSRFLAVVASDREIIRLK